jgi:predicted aspartyl protease
MPSFWRWPWSKSVAPSAQSVTFEFETRASSLFGTIYRPVADVEFWSETYQRWERIRMIVDTGADYTLLPRYVAAVLGLSLPDQTRPVTVEGVGGQQKVYFWESARVKLGPFERTIPVSFSDSNQVPSLMGRQQFLETFAVSFEGKSRVSFANLKP